MQNAMNNQINAELWSAYLYLAMAMDAEAKALKGISNWFFVQWLEEQDHARIFQNYMNDRGARVWLSPIDTVPQEWESPLEMFKDTLSHEKDVSAMIDEMVRLAVTEGDYATLNCLRWFIDEQVEEEKSAMDQVAMFERFGKDYAALLELDERLGERKYSKPDILSDK